jgi:hypothetical protein
MQRLQFKLLHGYSRAGRGLFLAKEALLSRSLSRRRLKVLFSPHAPWEAVIRKGLRRTRHQVTFEDLTMENIATHDVVVPLGIPAIRFLQEHRGRMPFPVFPIPSRESVELCDDKLNFNQAMLAKGFGEFIPAMEAAYPYVLKKRVDGWGQNCHVIRDARREVELAERLGDPDYYRQAFVPGAQEYATHLLFKDNTIRCALNIEYTFGHPFATKGKDVPTNLRICGCPHLGLFAAILQSIGFEGLCCVNYKPAGRTPMLLEINPRFGGSLAPYFSSFLRRVA